MYAIYKRMCFSSFGETFIARHYSHNITRLRDRTKDGRAVVARAGGFDAALVRAMGEDLAEPGFIENIDLINETLRLSKADGKFYYGSALPIDQEFCGKYLLKLFTRFTDDNGYPSYTTVREENPVAKYVNQNIGGKDMRYCNGTGSQKCLLYIRMVHAQSNHIFVLISRWILRFLRRVSNLVLS